MATEFATLRKYIFSINNITKFSHENLELALPNVHLEITQYFIHFLLTNKKNNDGFWPETWEKIHSIVLDSYCPAIDVAISYFNERRTLLFKFLGSQCVDKFDADVKALIAHKVEISTKRPGSERLGLICEEIMTFVEEIRADCERAEHESRANDAKLLSKLKTVFTFRFGKKITSTQRLRGFTPFIVGVATGLISYFSPDSWNDLSGEGYRLYQAFVLSLLFSGILLLISRRNFYRRMIAALLFPLTFPILSKAIIAFSTSETGTLVKVLVAIENEASALSTGSIYLIGAFLIADLISPLLPRH